MAEYTERTLVFTAESFASSVYPDKARNPTVAKMARTVITTMSSASVNHEIRRMFFRSFIFWDLAVFHWDFSLPRTFRQSPFQNNRLALAFFGFSLFSTGNFSAMILDTLQSFDSAALASFRSLVDPSSPWQTGLVHAFADIEVVIVAFVLVGLWLKARFLAKNDLESKKDALVFFYAIIFAFLLYWILNFGLPARPRPETASSIAPLIDHLPDNSFPSGHGIFAGASFVAAYRIFKSKTLAFVLLAFGIPMLLARVLAGIHYPGDVAVGFVVGSIFASVALKYLSRKEIRDSKLFALPVSVAAFVKL